MSGLVVRAGGEVAFGDHQQGAVGERVIGKLRAQAVGESARFGERRCGTIAVECERAGEDRMGDNFLARFCGWPRAGAGRLISGDEACGCDVIGTDPLRELDKDRIIRERFFR